MTETSPSRTDRIADLLRRIHDDGRIPLDGGLPPDFPPAMRVMPDGILMLNEVDAAALHEIVEVLGEDPTITRNARREDIERVVWDELASMLATDEQREIDAVATAQAIEHGVMSDLQPHRVYWPLRGMRLEEGAALTLAGVSIGALSAEERSDIDAESMRRMGEAAIGKEIPDSPCWAHIDIVARESSLREVVHEQLQLADAVLRIFNGAADTTLSIDYPLRGMHWALQYDQDEAGVCTAFTFRSSVYDRRTLFMLSKAVIAVLTSRPDFQAAQQIVATGQPNDMEIHLLHAMFAFRSATLADDPEEQLTIYLSIIEGLFGAESGEYRSRDRRAAERLATAWKADDRQTVTEAIALLFGEARTRPVHYGQRYLYGRSVVSRKEIVQAREYARNAILYALKHASQFTEHADFIAMLNEQVAVGTSGDTRLTYAVVVHQDPQSGQFVADVPDIPLCQGAGETAGKAVGNARTRVSQHVRACVARGDSVPPVLTATDKAIVQVEQP